MTVGSGDIVRSAGRITTIQDGRQRGISFDSGTVIDVGPSGIIVNPVGMKAHVLCRPEDLEPFAADPANEISAEGYSREQPESSEPEGTVPLEGSVKTPAKPKPKLVTPKKAVTPKPRPRRRRDR